MTLRRAIDLVLVGLAFAILDFRVEGFDFLPDPVGYALAAVGAILAARARVPVAWAALAGVAFALAALLAVPDAIAPRPTPPGFQLSPMDPRGALASGVTLAEQGALAALLAGVGAAAAALGAAPLARHARHLAVAFAALLALGLLLDVAWAVGGPEDTWPFALALLALELAAFVLAVVVLWRARSLAAPPTPAPTPAGEPI